MLLENFDWSSPQGLLEYTKSVSSYFVELVESEFGMGFDVEKFLTEELDDK